MFNVQNNTCLTFYVIVPAANILVFRKCKFLTIFVAIKEAPVLQNVKTYYTRGVLTVALERRAEKALSHVSEREQCEELVDAYLSEPI